MWQIYNLLVSFLGESKQGFYEKNTTQYQFNSPWATEELGHPDMKYNLEISLSLGKFHEWVNGYGGNISRLIKVYGGQEMLAEYFRVVKELKESRYADINLFKDDGNTIFETELLKLPESFSKLDLANCRDKALKEYCKTRHITQDIIDFYGIGYTPWEEEEWKWKNRLIVPSYNSIGELNFFVGRTYRDPEKDKRPKYLNCDADRTAIVNHEDKIQWDADIVLVEGALDCIYFPNSIALLGKTLTKESETYRQLKTKANAKIIICLDSDTKPIETKKTYRLLNTGRLKNKIWYVQLGKGEVPWKDFGEAYEAEEKEGIIKILKSARQYNEIDLLI